jgi:type II secretory pathway pseudopilin PulG
MSNAIHIKSGVTLCLSRQGAYTLLEVMFALALTMTLGAVAVPSLQAEVEDVRAAGAARYVATKFQHARMEAVARGVDVGWKFRVTPSGYDYTLYADVNGNGLRTYDIDHGIDQRIGPPERLAERFSGVDFGVVAGLPPIDAGGTLPGSDPIRLGASDILTFGPLGTATPGTVYLRGRRGAQYAIRTEGETGRTRVLRFEVRTHQWKPA